jgi:hypothetical protein
LILTIMPRLGRAIVGGAIATQAVSSARTNRAVRKEIEGQNDQPVAQAPAAAPVPQAPAPVAAPVADDSFDYVAELEKLADLKDKGIITQEEFDQKKTQILAKV